MTWNETREALAWSLGAVATIVGTALGLWKHQSKTRRVVSDDDVAVRENRSRVDWIASLEARLDAAEDRATAAEQRAAAAAQGHAACMADNARLHGEMEGLRAEVQRVADEHDHLARLLIALRPDLKDVLRLGGRPT